MDILQLMYETKKKEVAHAQMVLSLHEIKARAQAAEPTRSFAEALTAKANRKQTAIIAEIKKASPSKGTIRTYFDLIQLTQAYQAGGATCLSILTDSQYFQGDLSYLEQAKSVCSLPLLRKDFIIAEYQVYQSRVAYADAILLIAALLSKAQMETLEGLALENGLSVIVEVHAEEELSKIENLKTPLIGVNNRNLKNFTVNLRQTILLSKVIPSDKVVICESGIQSHEDIQLMKQNGIYTFLVGESLMRQDDVEGALKKLIESESL
ncbi:MAG: indole-3-glycerol phosphate synthase TrpC [Neisseriaceae bacterium]